MNVPPIVIVAGVVAVIVFFVQTLPEAKKARREIKQIKSNPQAAIDRQEAIREMARRDKERELERQRFKPGEVFFQNLVFKIKGGTWVEEFNEFASSSPGVSAFSARAIYILEKATRVVVLNCYGKGEWAFDELWQDPKAEYLGFSSWCATWNSKRKTSQVFRTQKAALAAWEGGEVWFDFNLESLEQVKAALESGEVLNVRYWGGSRSGKDRYVSITELNQLEAFEPGDPELWYAEVKEVDTAAEKTYRVDRMQIVPTNLRDRILDSLEDA